MNRLNVLIFISLLTFACGPGRQTRFVTDANFLILRESPSINSAIKGYVPVGTELEVHPTGTTEELVGRQGEWVELTGHGYLFGGFLSAERGQGEYKGLILEYWKGNYSYGNMERLILKNGKATRQKLVTYHNWASDPPRVTDEEQGIYYFRDKLLQVEFARSATHLKLEWLPVCQGYAHVGSRDYELLKNWSGPQQKIGDLYFEAKQEPCNRYGYEERQAEHFRPLADTFGCFCLP